MQLVTERKVEAGFSDCLLLLLRHAHLSELFILDVKRLESGD